MVRQIVLDTETTGLEPDMGHRIIEIGGVEIVNRRLTGKHFHYYINPERDVDEGAQEVHGLTRAFLSDKPLFAEVVDELVAFIRGAELVIHNAPFDVTFLNYEFRMLTERPPDIEALCAVTDSLVVARRKHPGQKNNLDALCRRYQVDNSQRQLHGALLDAEILADVYLLMTGGQTSLFGGADAQASGADGGAETPVEVGELAAPLVVVAASDEELAAHEAYLDGLADQGTDPLWRTLTG